MHDEQLAARIREGIRNIPDFPTPGVQFKDITTLMRNAELFSECINALATILQDMKVEIVVGAEARGFAVAAPAAFAAGIGFAPLRKGGKLPGPTISEDYELEYGTATLELHDDAFAPGTRVAIVDDVLATGGTALASTKLVARLGGVVAGLAFLGELADLGGRKPLADFRVEVLACI